MNQTSVPIKVRGRIAAYWLTGVGLALAFTALHGIEWRGSVHLHTHMEMIATLLAATVGVMALVRYYSKKDTIFLLIGTGFLGTAFLDGYHAVVTSEMFRPFMPSDLPSLLPWSWVASRQFLSILMFLSWFAWLRETRPGATGRVSEQTVYLGVTVITLVSFLFFALAPLPRAYYPELIFHRPEEFGPAIFFLLALVGYLKKGHWRHDSFEHWLVLSLIVGFIGQAAFMSLSGQLFDYEFDVAHLLKKVSYVCVLTGLLANMYSIFRQADESDERFRGAIASLQEGFALYDKDDRLVIFNSEFERLHSGIRDLLKPGLRFEDLLQASVRRGLLADAIGNEEEHFRVRLAQHRNPTGPIVRELADGTWYIISESRTPDGGIAVTETDITELKNAEAALRESEALTRRILEASPVGVLIVTRDGQHLFVNERALEIQGVSREELLSSNAAIYYAEPGIRKKLKNDLYKTGSTPPTEVELVKPDGTHYFVILSSTLTEFEGQTAHLTYLYDITERKQAEQALLENEERIRAIVDNVVDGIITIDDSGIIISINHAAERIFGYSEGELIGQNVSLLAAEPHGSAHDRYLANYLTTGEAKIIGQMRELEGRRKYGRRFPLELAVSELKLDDEQLFVGVVRDITARKGMDRMKQEFVSTVSHELRTPLTSIRGSLGLVTGGAVGKISKKAQEMIDMAEKNTDRLINLVNDILDMEKIESGSLEFRFGALDLSKLVELSLDANKGFADQYGIQFELVKTQPDVRVQGDSDRLMQVLANLLSNAAKFSPVGGKVEIAVTKQNGLARVSVSDHGPGIPEELHQTIFVKFTQADASDTRRVGGTGLGLNISKTIVEKHGGNIDFDTEVGVGTTFYFEIPILGETTEDSEVLSIKTKAGSRVLICEDDKDVAQLLSIVLKQNGFIADVAHTAAQARDYLNRKQYEAMTLDLVLPDEDGVSLLKSLRQDEKTKSLPIIVVSVVADERRNELKNGDAIGIIDWLTKPIDRDRLVSAVASAIPPDGADSRPRILYAEDDKDLVSIISKTLQDFADVVPANTLKEGKKHLKNERFDLVLIDVGLPDGSGLELLRFLRKNGDETTPVIIFSADEVDTKIAEEVNAALVKSRTSNKQLFDTVKSCIKRRKPEKQE